MKRLTEIPSAFYDAFAIFVAVAGSACGFYLFRIDDLSSVGYGLGAMVLSWGLALLCAMINHSRKVEEKLLRLQSALLFDEMYETDEANKILVVRLQSAVRVWNTCIFLPEIEPVYLSPKSQDEFDKLIIRAIKDGVDWDDVFSKGFEERAKKRYAACANCEGKYDYRILDPGFPIMNFIVIQYKDKSEEVWFGWQIESAGDRKTPAFRVKNKFVVERFKEWHRVLLRFSRISSGLSAGNPETST